ncbi:hypothetical protein [Nocardia salmonicida]|uniref:hypothetical protein n=1 Tax=Nocardia salmonicida TaxID=53431 RepID=UPI000ADB9314|nr:hypothetical protein [Nocardia salmonicida]
MRISPLPDTGDSQWWSVAVTEHQPGADPDTWIAFQTVTTRTVDGVTLISEIVQARPS